MKVIGRELCLQDLKAGDVFQFDFSEKTEYFMVCETDRQYGTDAIKNQKMDEKTNVVNMRTGITHWSVNEATIVPCENAVVLPHGEMPKTTIRNHHD